MILVITRLDGYAFCLQFLLKQRLLSKFVFQMVCQTNSRTYKENYLLDVCFNDKYKITARVLRCIVGHRCVIAECMLNADVCICSCCLASRSICLYMVEANASCFKLFVMLPYFKVCVHLRLCMFRYVCAWSNSCWHVQKDVCILKCVFLWKVA